MTTTKSPLDGYKLHYEDMKLNKKVISKEAIKQKSRFYLLKTYCKYLVEVILK